MYFEKPGKVNTEQTLKLAAERGKALGIKEVVLASTSGETAYRALEIMPEFKLVSVTYHAGCRKAFHSEMPEDVRRDLTAKGVGVVMASHALSGVEKSIAGKFGGVPPVILIANTLKRFGQGTKVAVEVAIMAADAGMLSGEDIIAIGGSGHGADTALVLTPVHQNSFFDLKIREILCKPRNF